MSDSPNKAGARRDAVLSRLRHSLGVRGDENNRKAIVKGRLENHPRGLVPGRGQVSRMKQIELFMAMAEAVNATTARVGSAKDVLPAITEFLRAHNLPAELVHGADPYLARLDWKGHKNLTAHERRAQADDQVSLVKAFGGVAESGTLVMLSGADNPVTLNFLPFTAIAVIETNDIAGDYETVWDRLRETLGAGAMSRTVNWITGPSRSADIEQTLLLGAHGPGRLHIIVVG